MNGSTFKRCQHGKECPDLRKKRHGSWFYALRLDTTAGRQLVRRGGFLLEREAADVLAHVQELIALDADRALRAKIGDMIVEATRRGGQLPDAAAVRRKLGAGLDPSSPDVTTGEWLTTWLAQKGKLKASVRRSYEQHVRHYLVPLLGEIPISRLRAEHIAAMFETIHGWNAAVAEQRAAGKALMVLDGDVRKVPQVVGNATMHRVYATLRGALNVAVKPPPKGPGLIPYNPCAGFELPPEEREPGEVWSPEQVGAFLDATAGHRLHLLWRIMLLRGGRRGESFPRWQDLDLDGGCLRVSQTILQLGGKVVFDTPKTKKSKRTVSLDPDSVQLLREHQAAQRRERFAAGAAYEDHGLIFCDEIGRPYPPDRVSAWFKQEARKAGLPVIRFHDGRHTAATMGLEAGIDIKIVSEQLGHSTTRITQDLYTHVRRPIADAAAARVAALVPRKAAQ